MCICTKIRTPNFPLPNLLFHSEISVRRKLDNSRISALPSRFQLPSFDCDVRWLLAADFRRRSVYFVEDVVMDDFGRFLVGTIRPYLFCSCISHVSAGRSPESCLRYRGSSCCIPNSIPPTFFFSLIFLFSFSFTCGNCYQFLPRSYKYNFAGKNG